MAVKPSKESLDEVKTKKKRELPLSTLEAFAGPVIHDKFRPRYSAGVYRTYSFVNDILLIRQNFKCVPNKLVNASL